MEEKILSLLVNMQADMLEMKNDMLEMKSDLKQVNQRLDKLEAGQKSLEAGQESIKKYIKENNLAIAEIITEAFEENERRNHNGNVYRLIPVEN